MYYRSCQVDGITVSCIVDNGAFSCVKASQIVKLRKVATLVEKVLYGLGSMVKGVLTLGGIFADIILDDVSLRVSVFIVSFDMIYVPFIIGRN